MTNPITKLLPQILQPAESSFVRPANPKVTPVVDVLSPKEGQARAERDAHMQLARLKDDWQSLMCLLDGRAHQA